MRRGEHFDLLLTDAVMPGGMCGRQLADEAGKLHADLPSCIGDRKALARRRGLTARWLPPNSRARLSVRLPPGPALTRCEPPVVSI